MLENTINWYHGEIFEGKMILLFGVIIGIIGFILYFWGTTPYAKALFVPMLVLGVSLIAIDYFSKERATVYYDKLQSTVMKIGD